MPGIRARPSARKRAFSWSSCKPLGTLLQRNESGGRQNTCLPHASAQRLANHARFGNECFAANQKRANGSSQAFGKAEHHRIALGRKPVHRHAQRDRGVENTRAVQVNGNSGLMRAVANPVHHRLRHHRSSGHVMRVFQRNQPGLRQVVDLGREFCPHQVPGQNAVRRGDRTHHASAEPAQHSHLVIEDVAAFFADDLLSGTGVQLDGDGVSHTATGHEDCRLASKYFGGSRLQPIDGWVLAINVVADLGLGHGSTHGCRGQSYGVAAQVHRTVELSELKFEFGKAMDIKQVLRDGEI